MLIKNLRRTIGNGLTWQGRLSNCYEIVGCRGPLPAPLAPYQPEP